MIKALVFILYYLFALPAGTMWAREKSGRNRDILFVLTLFSIIWPVLAYNLFPEPEWRGTARGFAFYITDFLTLILLLSMVGWRDWRFFWLPPGSGYYLLYFLLCLPSLYNASLALQWGFEVWKMVLMYLFYLACYNYILNRRELLVVVYTIIGTLLFMFLMALYQKYIQHLYHVAATFPHRNSMGMFTIVAGAVMFGILLNEKLNRVQWLLTAAALGASGMLVIFSYSRGGLFFYGLAMAITAGVTLLINGFSMVRIRILTVMAILMTIPLLIALPRIIERFLYAPESSAETRVNLAHAAVRMANDKFLGVGLNNFSDKSGPLYEYNYEHYQEFKDQEAIADRLGGVVETIYLLVAAECGWPGLAALLLWLGWMWLQNGFNLFAYRGREGFGFAAGIAGGLTANMGQSVLEWSLKQSSNFYELMLVFAIVGIMTCYRRRWKKRRRLTAT